MTPGGTGWHGVAMGDTGWHGVTWGGTGWHGVTRGDTRIRCTCQVVSRYDSSCRWLTCEVKHLISLHITDHNYYVSQQFQITQQKQISIVILFAMMDENGVVVQLVRNLVVSIIN